MRYRLSTLVVLTAVGPPALALAWFTLSLIFVQLIAIGLTVAVAVFSVQWKLLAKDAAEVKANRLRLEVSKHRRSTDNRKSPGTRESRV